jgi:hypothetical protein
MSKAAPLVVAFDTDQTISPLATVWLLRISAHRGRHFRLIVDGLSA